MNIIFRNLLRRKTRTLISVVGISIGVAAIILLGAMSKGLEAGYSSILTGTKADLILSQPDAVELSYSSVDESVGKELENMPEVAEVTGMIEGFLQSEGAFYMFLFGYPEDSFALERFTIKEGISLSDKTAHTQRGKPLILGSAAAEALKKKAGDTLRAGETVFRIVGIYETGDAFEDSGAVLNLHDAQELLGKPRQVSLFYIRLKDPQLRARLQARVERLWPNLELAGTRELADKQIFDDMMGAYTMVFAGLAIILGGVGMMNAQLMSVFERTREIGVLRAVGWSSRRVLGMILGESLLVCIAGGALGVGLGYSGLVAISKVTVMMGMSPDSMTPGLVAQAMVTVVILGLVGGLYPAWRASRLQPVEALRYEGGSTGQRVKRIRFGDMAIQSLRQRSVRTLLTLSVIAITVGALMAFQAVLDGAAESFTQIALGADAEIMVRQANISDTSTSALDERVVDRIAAMPEVAGVSGLAFTAVVLPEGKGFFILQGYQPGTFAMKRFHIIEGETLTRNRQMIIGKQMADSLNKGVGDTIVLSGVRFQIVGIYESSVSWEGLGGVITLRDAQTFMGRPRKVTMVTVKLKDPSQASAVVDKINRMPDAAAALAGEFIRQTPDMQASGALMNGISMLAIIVGGLGVMNTMLMSVFERTREIGVLRAVGWRRRAVMSLILREAVLLALLGGLGGMIFALVVSFGIMNAPMMGDMLKPVWSAGTFIQAILISLVLGALGGFYPAYRATRLQPVEALRYE